MLCHEALAVLHLHPPSHIALFSFPNNIMLGGLTIEAMHFGNLSPKSGCLTIGISTEDYIHFHGVLKIS